MGCVTSSSRWWQLSVGPGSDVSKQQQQQQPARDRQRRKRSSVPQHEFLTDCERSLVERTWRRISRDPVVIGTEVFRRIFELEPRARSAFSFSGMSEHELESDATFRSHAIRFMQAVDSVMANLDALDVIVIQNLTQLGRRHAALVPRFRVEYLDVFETAMADVWARRLGRRRFRPATRRAWTKIFHLITSSVSQGYAEQAAQNDETADMAASCAYASIAASTANAWPASVVVVAAAAADTAPANADDITLATDDSGRPHCRGDSSASPTTSGSNDDRQPFLRPS